MPEVIWKSQNGRNNHTATIGEAPVYDDTVVFDLTARHDGDNKRACTNIDRASAVKVIDALNDAFDLGYFLESEELEEALFGVGTEKQNTFYVEVFWSTTKHDDAEEDGSQRMEAPPFIETHLEAADWRIRNLAQPELYDKVETTYNTIKKTYRILPTVRLVEDR